MKTSAIILAAGASRRMGTPKALLDYRGQTFLDRLISIFAPVCSEVIAVLGRDARTIRAGLKATEGFQALSDGSAATVRFVINAEWELGQLSSLQCGLSAAGDGSEAIFFTPVDCPLIARQTPVTLRANFGSSTTFVIPRFDGRRGHPVLFDAGLASEFFALPASGSARDVVHRHVAATRYVDVDDPGILRDIDEPADYSALAGTTAQ